MGNSDFQGGGICQHLYVSHIENRLIFTRSWKRNGSNVRDRYLEENFSLLKLIYFAPLLLHVFSSLRDGRSLDYRYLNICSQDDLFFLLFLRRYCFRSRFLCTPKQNNYLTILNRLFLKRFSSIQRNFF